MREKEGKLVHGILFWCKVLKSLGLERKDYPFLSRKLNLDKTMYFPTEDDARSDLFEAKLMKW